jgi:O-antigen ligase
MAATGVCVAIFAIHQYYTGFARTLEYVQTHGGADAFTMDYLRQRRAFFPFVTPNTLAVYLVMTACLSRGVVRGTWYLAPITVALVLTKSVGGLITAFAAAMLYCALRSKSAARIIAIAILLMAAGCGIMLMRHRDSALHQHPAFSVLMRTAYWRQSAEIIAQHPWRGVGAGNFDLPRSRYAHNALLQTGAELGIPGILALSLCIGALGYALLRHCRRRTWTRQDASLAACIFAFAVHNLFDFSWFLPEINFLWWFTAGMLTAGIAAHTARPSTGT